MSVASPLEVAFAQLSLAAEMLNLDPNIREYLMRPERTFIASIPVRIDEGFKIIAVSNSKGGVYNRNGLNPYKIFEHKRRTGSVIDFEGGKNITNEELLELECDILIPAALENQITEKNAPNIMAKIVAEGANGPTTPEGGRILNEKGVFVIPDILANSGGG